MITLAGLRTLQTQILATDLDNYAGEAPADGDKNAQINWALRFISRRLLMIGYNVTLNLVASTQIYNLMDAPVGASSSGVWGSNPATVSLRVWYPFSITIFNQPLADRFNRGYGFWSLRELERQYPGFRGAAPGSPTIAVWLGNNGHGNLILYPSPTAGVVNAGGHYVSGLCLAPDLVNDNDVPYIPEDCHEAVAALAAVYAATPTCTEEEGWQRVQALGRFAEPVERHRMINKGIAASYVGSEATAKIFGDDLPQAQG